MEDCRDAAYPLIPIPNVITLSKGALKPQKYSIIKETLSGNEMGVNEATYPPHFP